jgi:hypothetical protein
MTTTVPIRLLILQRLQNLIASIVPITGVHAFTLAGKVRRGVMLIGADAIEDAPLVSIVEAPQTDINAVFTRDDAIGRTDMWNLFVQGVVQDDPLHPTDSAYALCAAVESQLSLVLGAVDSAGRDLYPEHHMLGGLIDRFEIMAPVVRPPETGVSSVAFFYLPLRVGVSMPVGQPYTTV